MPKTEAKRQPVAPKSGAKAKARAKDKRLKNKKGEHSPKEIQDALDRYHALVEKIAKLGIPPFSAAEEQREMRRKELGL
ncbi:MAG: hypothetical protein M5U26_29880 [Planctomycetota bacterium]|nr:hypothetical protein [Planctomycetota bacterium]